ncbi:MAG: putative protein related to plant photosystem stability/assembly factor [Gemmatimonadetes bacterium]|nr:putative protein related to plant photosystem stability/assembly factor [Gemmatimonadota bacterium]
MLYINAKTMSLLDQQDIDGLRTALQCAIELEHSTMPPYLYAWYSLGSSNVQVARTLESVVKEEMLHMLLACNILNAVGGRPKIDDPSFVPDYPTHLPGTVHGELTVGLEPFSSDLAKRTFMEIEEPEHPIPFGLAPPPPATIGVFYSRIKKLMTDLETRAASGTPTATIFTGDFTKQVSTGGVGPGLPAAKQKVGKLADAVAAIDFIVEQGEGTSASPNFAGQHNEFAHYYRFWELAEKRSLLPNPDARPTDPPESQFKFGDPIAIDEPAILPLVVNPKASQYQGDVRAKCDECNRAYTNVLKLLQAAFDGRPQVMSDAKDAMFALSDAARALGDLDVGNGKRAGPTFEYLP